MPKEKPQVFGLLPFVHCRMNLARGGGGQLLYKKRYYEGIQACELVKVA